MGGALFHCAMRRAAVARGLHAQPSGSALASSGYPASPRTLGRRRFQVRWYRARHTGSSRSALTRAAGCAAPSSNPGSPGHRTAAERPATQGPLRWMLLRRTRKLATRARLPCGTAAWAWPRRMPPSPIRGRPRGATPRGDPPLTSPGLRVAFRRRSWPASAPRRCWQASSSRGAGCLRSRRCYGDGRARFRTPTRVHARG